VRVPLEKPFCASRPSDWGRQFAAENPPHTIQSAALPFRNLYDTSVIQFHSYCLDRQSRAAWAKLCTLKQRVVQGLLVLRAAALPEILRKIKLDVRIELLVR
jgi:hypothetical protein